MNIFAFYLFQARDDGIFQISVQAADLARHVWVEHLWLAFVERGYGDQPQDTRKKATYEELNGYCMQLYEQNRQLAGRLRERDMASLFKRLDCLFLVLENKDCFSAEFVGDCADEIKSALGVPGGGAVSGGEV